MIEPQAIVFRIDDFVVRYARRSTVTIEGGRARCEWTEDREDAHVFDNIRQARDCAAKLGEGHHAVKLRSEAEAEG
jgi:hypothetical protein